MFSKVIFFKSIDSTNKYVLDNIASLNTGDVIYALQQTAGRGRLGRAWISEPTGNLYSSFVLKDLSWLKEITHLPILFAVAVRTFILNCLKQSDYFKAQKQLEFKWPNDILFDGKKLSGILIESDGSNFVVGIGINIQTSPDLNGLKTTSIKQIIELSGGTLKNDDILLLLNELISCVNNKIQEYRQKGFTKIKEEWQNHCLHMNKSVIMQNSGQVTFLGINDDGSAKILDSKGVQQTLYYGEIFT